MRYDMIPIGTGFIKTPVHCENKPPFPSDHRPSDAEIQNDEENKHIYIYREMKGAAGEKEFEGMAPVGPEGI